MHRLGNYEVRGEIARGSMGSAVLRAYDLAGGRDVALKTIRTGPFLDPDLKERFHREARVCAELCHPNIVSVWHRGETDDFAYLAMELLNGVDWRYAIEHRLDIPGAVKIDLMAQVCDGLAFAHGHHVIHRDIKPSNLFIHEGHTAKILDFGIARLPWSELTLAGAVLGTPDYMAPEQIRGAAYDHRADLFSAAVVFFQFLTGVHPFQSEFIPRRIVEGEPERLGDVDRAWPLSLEWTLAKALEKDPAQRYQTGAEFARALRAEAPVRHASPMI